MCLLTHQRKRKPGSEETCGSYNFRDWKDGWKLRFPVLFLGPRETHLTQAPLPFAQGCMVKYVPAMNKKSTRGSNDTNKAKGLGLNHRENLTVQLEEETHFIFQAFLLLPLFCPPSFH
jgi:hypothetical protein